MDPHWFSCFFINGFIALVHLWILIDFLCFFPQERDKRMRGQTNRQTNKQIYKQAHYSCLSFIFQKIRMRNRSDLFISWILIDFHFLINGFIAMIPFTGSDRSFCFFNQVRDRRMRGQTSRQTNRQTNKQTY